MSAILRAHAEQHPGVFGTFDPECPACRYDAAVAECEQIAAALGGALGKVDKQRAFLSAAEAEVLRLQDEAGRAAERLEAIGAELQGVSGDGVVGE